MNKNVLATAVLPLMLAGCIEQLPVDGDEEDNEPLTIGQLSQLSSVDVDGGKTTDWLGTEPVITDRVGDSSSPATDMVALYAARVGDRMALLMEVDGNITLPHTPSADYSHYEVGIDIYTDAACEDELGFVIVNHFTSNTGEVFHRLESHIDASEAETTVASAGSYLETSFSINDLPSATASIAFDPLIQKSGPPDYVELDGVDDNIEEFCYPLSP